MAVSNGGQHLRIIKAELQDQGRYVCRAKNVHGQIENAVDLTVKARKPRTKVRSESAGPKTIKADVGSSLEIKCDAMGDGSARFLYWTKDNRLLSSSEQVKQMQDGRLMLTGLSETMSGRYECIATRGRDRRTTSTLVTINSSPNIPEVGNEDDSDSVIVSAIEAATDAVNNAVAQTAAKLSARNKTISDSITSLRYPDEKYQHSAKGNEIYELAINALNENGLENLRFSDEDLELLANVSGCDVHRSKRNIDCSSDVCFHAKYRSTDGSCNNLNRPWVGSSLTTFKRLLPAQYENKYYTPVGELFISRSSYNLTISIHRQDGIQASYIMATNCQVRERFPWI